MQRAQVAVYDVNPTDVFNKHHCMNTMCRALHMAAQRARSLGWSNIYIMPEGIQGWIEAGLATASGSSDTPQALEVHRRQNFLRLTTETFS